MLLKYGWHLGNKHYTSPRFSHLHVVLAQPQLHKAACLNLQGVPPAASRYPMRNSISLICCRPYNTSTCASAVGALPTSLQALHAVCPAISAHPMFLTQTRQLNLV